MTGVDVHSTLVKALQLVNTPGRTFKNKVVISTILQLVLKDAPFVRGVTTLTNAVSGQSQNCSANLEISPGIRTLGNFSEKHAIIPGHCRKKS